MKKTEIVKRRKWNRITGVSEFRIHAFSICWNSIATYPESVFIQFFFYSHSHYFALVFFLSLCSCHNFSSVDYACHTFEIVRDCVQFFRFIIWSANKLCLYGGAVGSASIRVVWFLFFIARYYLLHEILLSNVFTCYNLIQWILVLFFTIFLCLLFIWILCFDMMARERRARYTNNSKWARMNSSVIVEHWQDQKREEKNAT